MRGISAAGYGVVIDAATDHVSVDETAIDPGCFPEVVAERKVRFDGGDAHRNAATDLITGTKG